MILRNDHLMRALQQMSEAFLRACSQTHDQLDGGAALATVDNALANTLGTRAELIGILDGTFLDGLDPSLRAHAARLFALRSRILSELKLPDQAIHGMRVAQGALISLLDHHFEDEALDAADHAEKLMKHSLAALAFTTQELTEGYAALFAHHASHSRFARAEDSLFHALEISPDCDKLQERGLAFYDHLLTLSDEALEAGGLPRGEVLEGRRELLESRR